VVNGGTGSVSGPWVPFRFRLVTVTFRRCT